MTLYIWQITAEKGTKMIQAYEPEQFSEIVQLEEASLEAKMRCLVSTLHGV
jgi:hypothetical protein